MYIFVGCFFFWIDAEIQQKINTYTFIISYIMHVASYLWKKKKYLQLPVARDVYKPICALNMHVRVS